MLRNVFLGLTLCFSYYDTTMVAAQTITCDQVTALASMLYRQETDTCALDRSVCAGNTQCLPQCIDGGDKFATSCTDGCSYQAGGFSVERHFSASSGFASFMNSAIILMYLGYSHAFAAGAEGYFHYTYEAGVTDDLKTVPAFQGSCLFDFNGNNCLCEQRYCDDLQQYLANYIDCTAFAGGSIINLCFGPPELTTESPLLDILHWLPQALCQGGAGGDGGSNSHPASPDTGLPGVTDPPSTSVSSDEPDNKVAPTSQSVAKAAPMSAFMCVVLGVILMLVLE